jgi:hypothetical protein
MHPPGSFAEANSISTGDFKLYICNGRVQKIRLVKIGSFRAFISNLLGVGENLKIANGE